MEGRMTVCQHVDRSGAARAGLIAPGPDDLSDYLRE